MKWQSEQVIAYWFYEGLSFWIARIDYSNTAENKLDYLTNESQWSREEIFQLMMNHHYQRRLTNDWEESI